MSSHPPLVPLLAWSSVTLSGCDARSFLNKFCTSDLKNLPVGQAQELMLLNPKGQVLAWGAALGADPGLHLLLSGLTAEQAIQHLDAYLFSEDVRMTAWEVTPWLAPPAVQEHMGQEHRGQKTMGQKTMGQLTPLLSQQQQTPTACAAPSGEPLAADKPTVWAAAGGANVIFAPTSLSPEQLETWWQTHFPHEPRVIEQDPLQAAQTYNRWRIQQRVPLVGQDTAATSLAQELLRDAWAISFTKGCYLGQETVARLDAMGHVNWNLRRLQLQSAWPTEQSCSATAQPSAAVALWLDDQAVGQLTSVCGTAALVRIRNAAAAQLLTGRCPDLQFRSANNEPLSVTTLDIA